MALPGSPYDGHTLNQTGLARILKLSMHYSGAPIFGLQLTRFLNIGENMLFLLQKVYCSKKILLHLNPPKIS